MRLLSLLLLSLTSTGILYSSPFLPEKNEGRISLSYIQDEWQLFDANTGTRGPVYAASFGDVKETQFLFRLAYGLRNNLSIDFQTGYSSSEISGGSPIPDNDGLADSSIGLSTTILSQLGDEGFPREAPLYLSFRLGFQAAGSYDENHSSKPLLNLPANGYDHISLSLYPGWISEHNFILSSELTYQIGLSDANDVIKARLNFEEPLKGGFALFQSISYYKSFNGFESGPDMKAAQASSGIFEANNLNESYNLFNIGLSYYFLEKYNLSLYTGSKFGSLKNTSIDSRPIVFSLTTSF